MKISINSGHTLSGSGSGAIGLLSESVETRAVTNALIKLLKEKGHTVYNHTVDYATTNTQYLQGVVDKVNSSDAELFVSIHFNAFDGKGNGTEAFTYQANELPETIRVIENLSALGFKNRCIKDGKTIPKDGSKLFVIRKTNIKAMLIEICFIDNKEDVQLYRNNFNNIVKAIASGITGEVFEDSIPSYVKEFEEAKKEMIALGVTDGSRPKDNITREEAWTMLHRLYKKLQSV